MLRRKKIMIPLLGAQHNEYMTNEELIIEMLNKMQHDISDLKSDINGLKDDVSEIKETLAEHTVALNNLLEWSNGVAQVERRVLKIKDFPK